MLRATIFVLLSALLCTCGPAQEDCEDCSAEERVARLEKIYHAAYQDLDAGVMERMLSENFVADYPEQGGKKSKEEFISELGQYRLIFPELTITVDSSKITEYQGNYFVQGTRTFSWQQDREPGKYRERFTNEWQQQADGWFLTASEIQTLSLR